jgi:hypothetical protein
MVQPLWLRPLLLSLAPALAVGCLPASDSGIHEDDTFSHRAYTSWAALPSADGGQLALLLEPRRVDAVSGGGPMISGWRGQVAGEAKVRMVVGPYPGLVVTTLPRAFHRVDGNAKTLFLWTLDAAEWSPVAPNDPPPPARYASVSWLDRATFVTQGGRTFDPPLEHPIVLGDTTLLDAPRDGASEVARPIRVAVHDYVKGGEEVLFADRGFDVATCAGNRRVTIAYQPESAVRSTVILELTLDESTGHTEVARRDVDELAPRSIVCRGGVSAIVGTRAKSIVPRTVIVHAVAGELALDLDAPVGGHAALSKDGTTLLAQREDGSATLVKTTGEEHIAIVRPSAPAVVSGDRAWLSTDDGAYVVRLDGTAPTVVKVSNTKASDLFASATGEGAFLAFETKYEYAHYSQVTTRAFVMSDAGPTNIAMPTYGDPYVAYADAKRAYVVGDLDDKADVVTIDLVTNAVTGTTPFPLCNREAMQTRGECAL